MNLSSYDHKLIRLTDTDGRIFTGVAEWLSVGYCLHEFGREEEGLQIGEYVFFASYIAKMEEMPGLVASDYEFHLPKPSYTWDTLQALSRDYPDRSFTLIIGADNWERFGNWHAHDQILANYDIVIYPRKGSRIRKSSLPPNVRLLRMPLINVSGTEIRQRMAEGLPIDDLVPARVAEMLAQDRQK